MFQIATTWNLSRPDESIANSQDGITWRGYSEETFLTGEFARKLNDDLIKKLSLSNIADHICPTRRDTYFYKGINRLKKSERSKTWGGKAGPLIEKHLNFLKSSSDLSRKKQYAKLRKLSQGICSQFRTTNSKDFEELIKLERDDGGMKEGDTEWLIQLLDKNGRIELAQKLLDDLIRDKLSVLPSDVIMGDESRIEPNVLEIGINAPATPDFLIPKHGIVGDIKTGISFEPHHQLTCAGYALAFENESKQKNQKQNIDWGIIYFFPTRNPSSYVRPLTFAQIYIFKIDNPLRQWFLVQRDEAYKLISKQKPPRFPKDKRFCPNCSFKDHCVSKGLKLKLVP